MPLAAKPPGSPRPTQSAIIVAVPETEPVVGPHRRRFDVAAEWGVPAHVTILYPFIDPAELSQGVVDRLRAVIRGTRSFTCSFRKTSWFDREVLWLAPDPDSAFRSLTTVVVRAFPDCLPYGGAFGSDSTPHLTVAESRFAESIDDVLAVERQVAPLLPVEAQVSEALLIAGTTAPASWGVVARLPLGT